MKFKVFSWIILILSLSELSLCLVEYRLPNTTAPIHYEIDLEVQLEPSFSFNGNVTIDIIIYKRTREIVLNAEDIDIYQDNYLIDKKNNKIYYFSHLYTKVNSFLKLKFENELNEGIYTLHLQFGGILGIRPNGLYRSFYLRDKEQRWLASTQFEPTKARRMLPCFDEPQYKTSFQLRVIHPRDRHAVSNSEISNIMHSGQKTMTSFKKTQIMSVYLLALAITDYDHVESEMNNKKFRIYVDPSNINNTLYAQNITLKAVSLFEKILDYEYTLEKLDQILIPAYSGGMENWGLIVYGKTLLSKGNKTSERSNENTLNLVCHELAHQWFGNLVTLKWWSHVWLNEGFATYYGHLCGDVIEPKRRIMDKLLVQDIHRVMVGDSLYTEAKSLNYYVETSKDILDKFDIFSYTKGAAIVRFMAKTFENYNSSIAKYLKQRAYSSAVPKDLFIQFDNSKNLPVAVSAETVLNTWTEQQGYPVITLHIDYETSFANVTQKRFLMTIPPTKPTEKWWIPLTMSTHSFPDFNNFKPIDWMQEQDDTIIIKLKNTNGWTILNNQQVVYCRVNYDEENWNRIIKYLNGTEYKTIHPLNRAQLLDDSMNLARGGELSYEIALNLTTYMHQEQDAAAWDSLNPNFGFLNNVLINTPAQLKLNKYALKLVNTARLSQVRKLDKKFKLDRNYVQEFNKKFTKLKKNNLKVKRKQLTRTFAILSDNIYSRNEYLKIEKLFKVAIDIANEEESEMSEKTLKKIVGNINYKELWMKNYYDLIDNWLDQHV